MNNVILPKIPSQLIRLALVDLQRVENDSRYKVDMMTWHEPQIKDTYVLCSVCLAGSVMAKTLEVPVDHLSFPDASFVENGKALVALDYFREGLVTRALKCLGFGLTDERVVAFRREHPDEVSFAAYKLDPVKFKQQLQGLADHLERRSL